MSIEIERVTKLEAAKRQLNTAIRLFFQREDCLSIHTLAAAAHGILLAIAKKRNPERALDSFLNPENPRIVPKYRQEYADIVRAAQNFLKHGSRDSDQVFDFRPQMTAYNVLDSLLLLEAIEGAKARSPEAIFFEIWFFRKYPDVMKEGPLKDILAKAPLLNPDDLESYGIAMKLWLQRTQSVKAARQLGRKSNDG